MLDRLINHARHEEEVTAGLFDVKGKGARKGGKEVSDGGVEQGALF